MCGISGCASARLGVTAADTIVTMTHELSHRGPDSCGFWNDEISICFGHARLAIQDLSTLGHQPMTSKSGRYSITFNGEIYNHWQLRGALPSTIPFAGRSDTETLLAVIEIYGLEDAIQKVQGMFAFALWDKVDSKLFLVRDRLGEKPLFYSLSGNTLWFASEIQPLARRVAGSSRVDDIWVQQYLDFGFGSAPRTIYRSVKSVCPAQIVTYDVKGNTLSDKYYWSPSAHVHPPPNKGPSCISFGSAVDAAEELIAASVSRQLVGDVKVGLLLSGGVDSTTICALMSKLAGEVSTFTIKSEESDRDDASAARKVAEVCGTKHTELFVTPQKVLDLANSIADVYGEPFGDISALPTLLVCELASSSVKVALTGDGGDEVFGGYNRYIATNYIRILQEVLPRSALRAMSSAMAACPTELIKNLFSVLKRLGVELSTSNMEEKKIRIARQLSAEDQLQMYSAALSPFFIELSATMHHDVLRNADHFASLNVGADKRILIPNMLDLMGYLPDLVLKKVDRAAMKFGLETRAPMLDHQVVEFGLSLPDKFRVLRGRNKVLLRTLQSRLLPKSCVLARKEGFSVPMSQWLRGPLREWAEDLYKEPRLKEVLPVHHKNISGVWQEHLTGVYDHHKYLWNLAMLASWLRRHAS